MTLAISWTYSESLLFKAVFYVKTKTFDQVCNCTLLYQKNPPLHSLILVCTFIDLVKKIPPARLLCPARLMFFKNFSTCTFISSYTSIRYTRVLGDHFQYLIKTSQTFPGVILCPRPFWLLESEQELHCQTAREILAVKNCQNFVRNYQTYSLTFLVISQEILGALAESLLITLFQHLIIRWFHYNV